MTKNEGQGLVEYGPIIVLVAILAVVILGGVGAVLYAFFVRFVGAVPWVY